MMLSEENSSQAVVCGEPLISVVIPIYNAENYIDVCLDSVYAQTYKNIEIVLVNDGSTDSSGLMCDEIASARPRHIVLHQENAGPSEARNNGVAAASGEYVLFLDADDVMHETCISTLYSAVASNDCLAACARLVTLDASKVGTYRSSKAAGECRCLSGVEMLKISLLDDSLLSQCCKLFPKSSWVKNPFPVGVFYEDARVMTKIFSSIDSVAYIDAPLYGYVQRSGSTTNGASDLSKRCFDLKVAIDMCCECALAADSDLRPWVKCYQLNGYAGLCMRLATISARRRPEMYHRAIATLRSGVLFALGSSLLPLRSKIKIAATAFSPNLMGLALSAKNAIIK